jgi:hypothetical protein
LRDARSRAFRSALPRSTSVAVFLEPCWKRIVPLNVLHRLIECTTEIGSLGQGEKVREARLQGQTEHRGKWRGNRRRRLRARLRVLHGLLCHAGYQVHPLVLGQIFRSRDQCEIKFAAHAADAAKAFAKKQGWRPCSTSPFAYRIDGRAVRGAMPNVNRNLRGVYCSRRWASTASDLGRNIAACRASFAASVAA